MEEILRMFELRTSYNYIPNKKLYSTYAAHYLEITLHDYEKLAESDGRGGMRWGVCGSEDGGVSVRRDTNTVIKSLNEA